MPSGKSYKTENVKSRFEPKETSDASCVVVRRKFYAEG